VAPRCNAMRITFTLHIDQENSQAPM